MVYDKIIRGKFITLRSIEEDDAEFSYAIRSAEGNRETVGQLAPSIEAQREYIARQRERDGDYYFVILNNDGERVGLIGIYDIVDDIGEIGRLVCNSAVESLEAQILIDDFAIDVLGLKRSCCVIYMKNSNHISAQAKMGNDPIKTFERNGEKCYYYETNLSKDNTKKIRQLINNLH